MAVSELYIKHTQIHERTYACTHMHTHICMHAYTDIKAEQSEYVIRRDTQPLILLSLLSQ